MAESKTKWSCYVDGCKYRYANIYDLGRHFEFGHRSLRWDIKRARNYKQSPDEFRLATPSSEVAMDAPESSKGRPQREKKPTEKVRAVSTKPEAEQAKEYLVPPKYIAPADDPKFLQEPREIAKTLDHTKTSQIT